MIQSSKPLTTAARSFAKLVTNFVLILLLCFEASAFQPNLQSKFKLEGRIVDSTGAPVSRVQILRLAGSTRVEETTNDEGRFSFGEVEPGRYELQVIAKGFKEAV